MNRYSNPKWALPTTHGGSSKRGSSRLTLAMRRTALTRGVGNLIALITSFLHENLLSNMMEAAGIPTSHNQNIKRRFLNEMDNINNQLPELGTRTSHSYSLSFCISRRIRKFKAWEKLRHFDALNNYQGCGC